MIGTPTKHRTGAQDHHYDSPALTFAKGQLEKHRFGARDTELFRQDLKGGTEDDVILFYFLVILNVKPFLQNHSANHRLKSLLQSHFLTFRRIIYTAAINIF